MSTVERESQTGEGEGREGEEKEWQKRLDTSQGQCLTSKNGNKSESEKVREKVRK